MAASTACPREISRPQLSGEECSDKFSSLSRRSELCLRPTIPRFSSILSSRKINLVIDLAAKKKNLQQTVCNIVRGISQYDLFPHRTSDVYNWHLLWFWLHTLKPKLLGVGWVLRDEMKEGFEGPRGKARIGGERIWIRGMQNVSYRWSCRGETSSGGQAFRNRVRGRPSFYKNGLVMHGRGKQEYLEKTHSLPATPTTFSCCRLLTIHFLSSHFIVNSLYPGGNRGADDELIARQPGSQETPRTHSLIGCMTPRERALCLIGYCLLRKMCYWMSCLLASKLPGADWRTVQPYDTLYASAAILQACGATVAKLLARSPPTKANRVHSSAGGNRAGRCRWSAGFLGDLPFPTPLHSGAAPCSLDSPSLALKISLLRAAKISSLASPVTISVRLFNVHDTSSISTIGASAGENLILVPLLPMRVIEVSMEQRRNAKGGRESPEKTCWPAASSGTIPRRENPGATPPEIERCSLGRKVRDSAPSPPCLPEVASPYQLQDNAPLEPFSPSSFQSKPNKKKLHFLSLPPAVMYCERAAISLQMAEVKAISDHLEGFSRASASVVSHTKVAATSNLPSRHLFILGYLPSTYWTNAHGCVCHFQAKIPPTRFRAREELSSDGTEGFPGPWHGETNPGKLSCTWRRCPDCARRGEASPTRQGAGSRGWKGQSIRLEAREHMSLSLKFPDENPSPSGDGELEPTLAAATTTLRRSSRGNPSTTEYRYRQKEACVREDTAGCRWGAAERVTECLWYISGGVKVGEIHETDSSDTLRLTYTRYNRNTARLELRSDEALGVRVTVARIAPSLLDLGRAVSPLNDFTSPATSHCERDYSVLSVQQRRPTPTARQTSADKATLPRQVEGKEQAASPSDPPSVRGQQAKRTSSPGARQIPGLKATSCGGIARRKLLPHAGRATRAAAQVTFRNTTIGGVRYAGGKCRENEVDTGIGSGHPADPSGCASGFTPRELRRQLRATRREISASLCVERRLFGGPESSSPTPSHFPLVKTCRSIATRSSLTASLPRTRRHEDIVMMVVMAVGVVVVVLVMIVVVLVIVVVLLVIVVEVLVRFVVVFVIVVVALVAAALVVAVLVVVIVLVVVAVLVVVMRAMVVVMVVVMRHGGSGGYGDDCDGSGDGSSSSGGDSDGGNGGVGGGSDCGDDGCGGHDDCSGDDAVVVMVMVTVELVVLVVVSVVVVCNDGGDSRACNGGVTVVAVLVMVVFVKIPSVPAVEMAVRDVEREAMTPAGRPSARPYRYIKERS
ncbi:hypothetical protein PR048_001380 [Dryococelus australis]|uniref:Uncharacterized protein n=1 Tax=Dryococelus australis TaxID=614101 RepID=A0ABQ9IHB7_9NEOP|nr:hypothetical protein PR048_001380 [Dryococelus australis]